MTKPLVKSKRLASLACSVKIARMMRKPDGQLTTLHLALHWPEEEACLKITFVRARRNFLSNKIGLWLKTFLLGLARTESSCSFRPEQKWVLKNWNCNQAKQRKNGQSTNDLGYPLSTHQFLPRISAERTNSWRSLESKDQRRLLMIWTRHKTIDSYENIHLNIVYAQITIRENCIKNDDG